MDYEQLIFYTEICGFNKNVSTSTYYVLALTCKELYNLIQYRLDQIRAAGLRAMPIIGKQVIARQIAHPIEYDRSHTHVQYIDDMHCSNLGLDVMFDFPQIPERKLAFANCSFITKYPDPHTIFMYIGTTLIYSRHVVITDYMRLRFPINGPDDGRYILNLALPTRYNPILVGSPQPSQNVITICMTKYTWTDDGINILFDVGYISTLCMGCIVRAYSCDSANYDWDKYGVFVADDLDQVCVSSLVMKMDG